MTVYEDDMWVMFYVCVVKLMSPGRPGEDIVLDDGESVHLGGLRGGRDEGGGMLDLWSPCSLLRGLTLGSLGPELGLCTGDLDFLCLLRLGSSLSVWLGDLSFRLGVAPRSTGAFRSTGVLRGVSSDMSTLSVRRPNLS